MSNFGIDLLLESQKLNIQSKNDILIICMHWMLCRNNLRNVGVGDDKNFNADDRASELLPELWNSDQNTYALRYTIDEKIFILHGIVSSDTLIVNLLDAKSLKTACLVFEVEKVVKSKTGITLNDFVFDSEELISRIEKEIVKPIITKKTEEKPQESNPTPSPLLVQPPRQPIIPHFGHEGIPSFRDPLRDIGRGDLDPLGRGGGGMIFQPDMPFRPGFGPLGPLPGPGSMGIPPGARYDPINPLRRHEPDNDHFRPPGNPPPGYDDMFM